jgi:hypothetical protein
MLLNTYQYLPAYTENVVQLHLSRSWDVVSGHLSLFLRIFTCSVEGGIFFSRISVAIVITIFRSKTFTDEDSSAFVARIAQYLPACHPKIGINVWAISYNNSRKIGLTLPTSPCHRSIFQVTT